MWSISIALRAGSESPYQKGHQPKEQLLSCCTYIGFTRIKMKRNIKTPQVAEISCQVSQIKWSDDGTLIEEKICGTWIQKLESGHFAGRSWFPGKMIYLEPNMGSDCLFTYTGSGFVWNGVHHQEKYWYKWLFFKNIHFNRDLSLPFNGLLTASFLQPYLYCEKVQKATGRPLVPAKSITSENFVIWGLFTDF